MKEKSCYGHLRQTHIKDIYKFTDRDRILYLIEYDSDCHHACIPAIIHRRQLQVQSITRRKIWQFLVYK